MTEEIDPKWGSQKKQLSLLRRFAVFSVILFLLISVIGSAVFISSMRQTINENKDNELRRILEIERIKLENLVSNVIAVALQMSGSPLIRHYFADPGDPWLKDVALEEIDAYCRALAGQSVFWVNDIDKMFYYGEADPYVVDPDDPANYWYRMTLYETELYNFNINYNPDLNVTNLWINMPIRGDDGQPLGMIGTGVDLSEFIEMLYKNYTGKAELYFFNAEGEITGAKSAALVAAKKNIEEELSFRESGSIVSAAKSLQAEQIQTIDIVRGKAALSAIPLLDWYSLAVTHNSIDDYKNAMTMLFFVMLAVIAIVLIICYVVISTLLKPLREAMAQTETAFLTAEFEIMKYRLTSDALNIAHWDMVIKDPDDPVNLKNTFKWSPEIRSMLGFSDENDFPDVLKSITDRLHPDDFENTIANFAAHINDRTGKTPYNDEYRLFLKNGECRHFQSFGSTMRDNEGVPLRVAGALRDITESVQIRKTLEKHDKMLEAALEQATAASRAKSDFLASMSHEIRTPMNAIIGMTSIGMSSDDPQRIKYCFAKIDNASKHLLGVINDVLDMSKIEADKLELSSVSFDFEKMIHKVVNVINFRVDERKQKFYIKIDKDIPCALIGDDQRLSQVITNLLSNAVKFTPDGGAITLDSRLVCEENNLCRLQISVTDTGIGITDDQKARLFHAFEQAEIGTSRKFGGTGLGLAISKRIVELMGGEIWVESEPGRGSSFTFTVLMKRDAQNRERLLPNDVSWQNLRIFAVDDEPEIRDFFVEMSASLGITCDVAASGEEAAAMLARDSNYNLYFIDWKLPGMNGIDLARNICKNSGSVHKPVVIIFSSTDWSDIEIESETRGVSIDKFLPKPLFKSDIIDLINEFLGSGTATKQSGQELELDDFTRHTILLVEDIEINREIVIALLEPTRLHVECAQNGIQAVQMFKAAPDTYDMIFMDLQMPEMDGYEATRKIREIEAQLEKNDNTSFTEGETRSNNKNLRKQIPIIAMTANVFREDVEKCLEAGMNGHVGKPLDLDDVLKHLRKYLIK